jgi:hypothetical protein
LWGKVNCGCQRRRSTFAQRAHKAILFNCQGFMTNQAAATEPRSFPTSINVNSRFVHAITTRILSVIMTCQWYLLFVHSTEPEKRFSFEYLRYSGSIAIALTVGLWLSTMRWSTSHRVVTAVLLLPSLSAPLFIASNIFYIFFIFLIVAWSYSILFNKQRNT